MSWFCLYEVASGRALSFTTTQPVPAAGQAFVVVAAPPGTTMWDETTRLMVPRPAKLMVDRLQDLANDPELSGVWAQLTVAQRQTLRDRLIRLLGRHRFRPSAQRVDFDA